MHQKVKEKGRCPLFLCVGRFSKMVNYFNYSYLMNVLINELSRDCINFITYLGCMSYVGFLQEVFRIAISRYVAKPEKKDLLMQLLQWMSGRGYTVDSLSRNLLLKKAHLFGEKQLIAEVLSKQHAMSRKLRKPVVKKDP